MDERSIARYAAKIATGVIIEEELAEIIGDDNIVQQIMSVAGAGVIVGAASSLIDDAVDTTMDVVDIVNPFKW